MASSFQISGPAASLTGVTGDDCSQDYVLVYSAAASPTAVGTNRYDVILIIFFIIIIIIIRWDKMCGAYWGVSGNPGITVYSTKLPFQLLVNFDGTEVESFSRYIYRSICIIYLYLYFRWNPPQQPPKTLLASICTTNRLPADEDRRLWRVNEENSLL